MSGHNLPLFISCVQLQPLAPESSLSYSHLSHSVSSHLDSSPESSEAGADIPLSRSGKKFKRVFMQSAGFIQFSELVSEMLKESEQSKITNISLCLHRAAADPKRGPEHCRKSSPSTLQSPGGGCLAVTPTPISLGPQEAEEQPLFE